MHSCGVLCSLRLGHGAASRSATQYLIDVDGAPWMSRGSECILGSGTRAACAVCLHAKPGPAHLGP